MRLPVMLRLAMTAMLTACAAALPPATDWRAITLIERNAEGPDHLEFPKELPGCSHLGMTRVTILMTSKRPPAAV